MSEMRQSECFYFAPRERSSVESQSALLRIVQSASLEACYTGLAGTERRTP
jgi:hypothetical protein